MLSSALIVSLLAYAPVFADEPYCTVLNASTQSGANSLTQILEKDTDKICLSVDNPAEGPSVKLLKVNVFDAVQQDGSAAIKAMLFDGPQDQTGRRLHCTFSEQVVQKLLGAVSVYFFVVSIALARFCCHFGFGKRKTSLDDSLPAQPFFLFLFGAAPELLFCSIFGLKFYWFI